MINNNAKYNKKYEYTYSITAGFREIDERCSLVFQDDSDKLGDDVRCELKDSI